MRRWSVWGVVVLAVFALVSTACSDVATDEPTGGETTAGGASVAQCGDEPIVLAVNQWVGAEANAAVVEQIMENEMGCEVEQQTIAENPQFPGLARGDLDAVLEVWPSVHADDEAKYIDDPNGGVVNGGELGIIGNIGWFVPQYVLDEYPEFATWEGLKGQESYFATAESGDQGQFLGSDPAFGYFDEAIIESLGLDFKWVPSGSEDGSLAALDKAFAAQDPLLMYFWSPHWALVKYDLVEVELPPFDDQCAEAALTADAAGYDCDYADDVLYKAFSAQLEEKDPAAFAFLSNFQWTADDQNGIAAQIQEGVPNEEAAQEWLDANESVWQAWLPASTS